MSVDGRGGRPALAQPRPVEVVPAHDALLEARWRGRVAARTSAMPSTTRSSPTANVDAEFLARREEQADGEHVGGVQLEVATVPGERERLARVEVTPEVTVGQPCGIDRREGLVRRDRSRAFRLEVPARDVPPRPFA